MTTDVVILIFDGFMLHLEVTKISVGGELSDEKTILSACRLYSISLV